MNKILLFPLVFFEVATLISLTPMSYVYAVAITIVFTAIVNIVTYFALKKINMISSLKSVE